MPLNDVNTIEKLIFYQYAKIIVKSAKQYNDGKSAKNNDFGLIRVKYNELITGKIKWSDILREDIQFVNSEKVYAYCGSNQNISKDHIVPRTLNITEKCFSCDKIQSIHNIIFACKSCNSSKGTQGLYTYYQKIYPDNKKFYDFIPSLLEKKYLKTIWHCHNCNGSLKKSLEENVAVINLDFSIAKAKVLV